MEGFEQIVGPNGFPYAGGNPIQFSRAEVLRVGKMVYYNSSIAHHLVELTGGRIVFIILKRQDKADKLWLRLQGITRRFKKTTTQREPWEIKWTDVEP